MNVNLSNAVRMFYGKSSYEMVYMEAIANALDAKATEISVEILAFSSRSPKAGVIMSSLPRRY